MEANLGRKSLHSRLTQYYGIVAPDKLITFDDKWYAIYAKYGGSIEGEAKLQKKLSKMYGREVLLNIVVAGTSTSKKKPASRKPLPPPLPPPAALPPIDDTLLLTPSTGVTDFTSPTFDPYTALQCSHLPTTSGDLMLDNVERCRHLLPQHDEFYAPLSSASQSTTTETKKSRSREAPPFIALADSLSKTPFSTLHKAMTLRRKVKVTVRYVNCIRGHVVGSVQGFDKHFNMLLTSATETYATRLADACGLSQAQVESSRRRTGFGKGLKSRRINQMMIRGDMVVSVQLL